jgi:lactobin A/cerein 7B family class IIb bacteriocin
LFLAKRTKLLKSNNRRFKFKRRLEMRELTHDEIEEVSGGVGPIGAVIGGLAGGLGAGFSGQGVGGIISGATFGAVSGFFGGIAGATTGFARYSFSAYAVGTGVIGSQSMETS